MPERLRETASNAVMSVSVVRLKVNVRILNRGSELK